MHMHMHMHMCPACLPRVQAGEARDALIKHVYGVLFLWLVTLINRRSTPAEAAAPTAVAPAAPAAPVDRWAPRVSAPSAPAPAAASGRWEGSQLGLLDIYGFENLEVNSLEQLCINYANEIMQKQAKEHTRQGLQPRPRGCNSLRSSLQPHVV